MTTDTTGDNEIHIAILFDRVQDAGAVPILAEESASNDWLNIAMSEFRELPITVIMEHPSH